MREQLFRIALSQSTSAIGQFVRAWLLCMAGLSIAASGWMLSQAAHVTAETIMASVAIGVLIVGPACSLPVAIVLVVLFAAVKF